VPAELIDTERRSPPRRPPKSGKPAEIVAKIVEGSVQKFLKEVTLLNQVFVKADDGKQTVEQMLKGGRFGEGLHAVRRGRGHREEGRRLRCRSGGPGRRCQGPVSREEGACGAPRPYTSAARMPAYKRILLKLSGEALMGDDAYGINRATIVRMVREVQACHRARRARWRW
jgi:hypothetical protein